MQTFWRILGISPTQDRRAIKKAYAARLKHCHPEDNPEGFRQLHAAYQEALDTCPRASNPRVSVAPPPSAAPPTVPVQPPGHFSEPPAQQPAAEPPLQHHPQGRPEQPPTEQDTAAQPATRHRPQGRPDPTPQADEGAQETSRPAPRHRPQGRPEDATPPDQKPAAQPAARHRPQGRPAPAPQAHDAVREPVLQHTPQARPKDTGAPPRDPAADARKILRVSRVDGERAAEAFRELARSPHYLQFSQRERLEQEFLSLFPWQSADDCQPLLAELCAQFAWHETRFRHDARLEQRRIIAVEAWELWAGNRRMREIAATGAGAGPERARTARAARVLMGEGSWWDRMLSLINPRMQPAHRAVLVELQGAAPLGWRRVPDGAALKFWAARLWLTETGANLFFLLTFAVEIAAAYLGLRAGMLLGAPLKVADEPDVSLLIGAIGGVTGFAFVGLPIVWAMNRLMYLYSNVAIRLLRAHLWFRTHLAILAVGTLIALLLPGHWVVTANFLAFLLAASVFRNFAASAVLIVIIVMSSSFGLDDLFAKLEWTHVGQASIALTALAILGLQELFFPRAFEVQGSKWRNRMIGIAIGLIALSRTLMHML